MKKRIYFNAVVPFITVFGTLSPIAASGFVKTNSEFVFQQKDITPLLINEDGLPTNDLKELLILSGIPGPYDSLAEVVQKTQEKWLAVKQGVNNIERRDLVDSEELKKNREAILSLAENLGLFHGSLPSLKNYKYGICPGAFLSGVRERMYELVESWKRGVRFENLVFFGSERALRNTPGGADDFNVLIDESSSPYAFRKDWRAPKLEDISYQTEYDMMKIAWDQIDLPEEMRNTLENKVVFVFVPRGDFPRPALADGFKTWLREFQPEEGSILMASSSVYWTHQYLVGLNNLGDRFDFDIMSPSANKDKQKVRPVLDTLAKCLFEIQNKD